MSQSSNLLAERASKTCKYLGVLHVAHGHNEIWYSNNKQENEGCRWGERGQRVEHCMTVVLQPICICLLHHDIVIDLPVAVHPKAKACVENRAESAEFNK